jgi:ABC-type sugar transport system substrate-binding protein
MKQKNVVVFVLLLALSFTVFVSCSKEKAETQTASFTPADQIIAPAGKTLASLPVDQVAEKPIRIAAIMVQNNPFGQAVLQGEEFAKEILADRNCIVDCLSVEDFDVQKWTSVIDNCTASGYDAICAFGVSDALQPAISRAVDAGLLVYLFTSNLSEGSKHQAWYGQGLVDGGRQCGEALEKLMGGEGKYAIITGDFSAISHEQRRTGARSVLDANPKITLVGEVMNNDKAEEAYNHATNFITANPDLKGIYVTAGGPSGAAKAVADAGLSGKVVIVAHDVLAESAPYIASGTIQSCLDQEPFNQGYQPVVDAYNKLVAGITPPKETFYKGVMATPDNVKTLFPEFF